MCFDDGGGGFKLEAGVAPEGVAGAVEDAEEFVAGGGVEVVGDGLGVHGEGGGVVGELGLGNSGGDGLLTTVLVEEDGDVWGGVAVVGGGEFSGGIVVIGGGDVSRPGAGFQTTGRGVGVVGAFAIGVLLAGELLAGVVGPGGGVVVAGGLVWGEGEIGAAEGA